MRGRHVARRFQGICRSRYGRASLAAGEGGAFQSWLGYTIVEAAREKREKNQTEGGELQGGKFLESLERDILEE